MTPIELSSIIVATIAGLGGIVFSVAYLVSNYMQGKSKQKVDVISSSEQLTAFWKEQVEGFKEIVATQNEKIRSLTGQLGELRGRLDAEKRSNDELKAIFQGRNPEMDTFMRTMVSSMGEIRDFMKSINDHLKDVDKDLKIEATISKQE